MKNFTALTKFTLLFVLMMGTNLFAEVEPNDTYQQANMIGPNATDGGALNDATQSQPTADNIDWWVVTLPYDGGLYVEANAFNGLMDVELHIYDVNGISQISSLDISVGTKEATHKSNLKTGTYYIRVYRYSGSGTYTIQTVYTQAIYANDSEPNDNYLTALTLDLNSETTGHIGYFGNQSTDTYDWWKITLPSDGSLKIRTESDSADIELHIYDVNGINQISSLDISTGLNEETHKDNLLAGTYYIRASLYSKHGGYRIISTYTPISIEGVLTNDSEPNDEYSTSQSFGSVSTESSSTNHGHIGYYGDNYTDSYDWWRITLLEDGKLTLKTFSNESLDLDMWIYDVNGLNQISSLDISTGINEKTHRDDLAAGTYYIKVFAYYGFGAYKITAEYTPTSLSNDSEPNNEMATAVSIAPDVIKTGHIGYFTNGNTDIYDSYVFTITSAWDSLYVRVDTDTADIDLALYNGNGNTLATAGAYGKEEIMSYPNAQAGTYYIRVFKYSGHGSYAIKLTNRYPHSPVTDVKEENESILPLEFSLYQNYPNPFNPTTTIKYDIPDNSLVTLKIYDVLGNEVTTLVNKQLSAGSYKVDFNAGNLSSGIYFYRIDTGKFSQTKKLILIK